MDRIDVYTIARSGAQWEGRLPLAAMPRLGASLSSPGPHAGAVKYRCRGYTDAQGRPALMLGLDAILPLRCDRCAQELALVLAAERPFYFVASGAEMAAIPVDDSPEEPLLASAQFDLAGLIEDETILQLPLSPRHADCLPTVAAAAASAPRELPAGELLPAPVDSGAPAHPFAGLAALRGRLHRSAAGDPAVAGPVDTEDPAAKAARLPGPRGPAPARRRKAPPGGS